MLNFHTEIINNTLYNTLIDSLPENWFNRLLPFSKGELISGYYNAGVLSIRMYRFNEHGFYENEIKNNFKVMCDDLFIAIKDAVSSQLRRMFLGFNPSLEHYKIVIIFEGADKDNIEAQKYDLSIF